MNPHSLRTEELDYELPTELVATQPASPRDSARMMVIWRSKSEIEHRQVRDLPEFLNPGDALVFNTTAVLPARLVGRRADTAGKVEGLYLHDEPSQNACIWWRMMLRAGGRLRAGQKIEWTNPNGDATPISVTLVKKAGAEWVAQMEGAANTSAALQVAGLTPLPPYIIQARGAACDSNDNQDRLWYQTAYADPQQQQSVAAPTAGLHFTPELLSRIARKGVERIDITLHVGAGTFKPITATTLAEHQMHPERFEITADAVRRLSDFHRHARVHDPARRLIAVGTTTVRTLESLSDLPSAGGEIYGQMTGMTDLMIAPPHEFRLVHGMLTNFHLPRSTLLALVASMLGEDGLVRLKMVYREAIQRRYRFYSYGDAMLILP